MEEDEEVRGGDAEADKYRKTGPKEDESDDFFRELSIRSLRYHYVRANKEYEQFRTMINAQSYDESLLSESQATFYKKSLKTRVRLIEDTIDIHLKVIGGLERYIVEPKGYMHKMRLLEANEEKIHKKYVYCQRMTDFMQSYNMFDSEEFHQEKQILDRLDRETLELDFGDDDTPYHF